jgi:iron complex outermembrane receptor protein
MKARIRTGFENLHSIQDINRYRPSSILCNGANLASCQESPNYNDNYWLNNIYLAQNPYYGLGQYNETPISEVFDYTSFNPAVGVSYLPFKGIERLL